VIEDVTDEQARAAFPLKWGAVEPGVLPAWIAEMDLRLAPVVEEAVVAALRRGTAGYPRDDGTVGAAYAAFADRHWGWLPPADASVVVGDVIAGIRLVLEVLCPPGPVVVPVPCYPPFREVVAVAGRELVPVVTDPDDDVAELDLEAMEVAFAGGARTLLLCSPHNPLGRVWTRAELEALRELTSRYDVRVVADEIHGPLVLPGATFVPYLTVDPTALVVTSASKAFNVAGLHCAHVLTLDPAERERLRGVPLPMNNSYSPLGILAAATAYEQGDPWLSALVRRLDEQRTLLGSLLADLLPDARMRSFEATYLPWLDLRRYGVADPAAAAVPYGVRLSPGSDYQPGLEGHVRINIATSPDRLTRIVERLSEALAHGTTSASVARTRRR
jgi:cystathionine beta-lyase